MSLGALLLTLNLHLRGDDGPANDAALVSDFRTLEDGDPLQSSPQINGHPAEAAPRHLLFRGRAVANPRGGAPRMATR